MVQRARIVLLSADGLEVHEIGARLSVDRQVVRRWVKRYVAEGFDGLRDRQRSGRPPEIEHHVWQKLATIVVQPPEKFGWSLARWSVRALREFLARRFGWDISRSSISRFLRSMAFNVFDTGSTQAIRISTQKPPKSASCTCRPHPAQRCSASTRSPAFKRCVALVRTDPWHAASSVGL